MIFYIIPYCILVILSVLILKIKTKKLGFLLFTALFPAFLLVILRGNVGIDIELYLNHFSFINQSNESPYKFEPGFLILSKIISFFTSNERLSINIISSITTILLVSNFSKKKTDIILFSFLVFPFFYYDMTMNGIRYGLSFSLAAISVQYLFNKSYIKSFLWGLLAISIQYSSIIIFVPFLLSYLNKKQLLYLIGITLLIASSLFSAAYFRNKVMVYSQLYSPSFYSGLSSLLISFLLLFTISLYQKAVLKTKVFYYLILMVLFAYLFTFISYAGLRIQATVLFLIILYLKIVFENFTRKKDVFLIIFIVGLFGLALRLRNFNTFNPEITTPFIPYHFFWQI